MKIKLLLAITLILISVISFGSSIIANSNTINANQNGGKLDISVAKTKNILKTDRVHYKNGLKEIALDVKWGNGEEQLRFEKYQDAYDTPVSYVTPASFTVDHNGCIYVYDTLNNKVKVYKNNRFIKGIAAPIDTDEHQKIPFVLRDMAVNLNGELYGLNYLANEVIKVDSKGVMQVVFNLPGTDAINRPETIEVLNSGNVMIRDNYDPENATRVRKFDKDGNVVSCKKLSNYIDLSLYEYDTVSGDTISIAPIGLFNYQFAIWDQSNVRKAICNYSIQPPAGMTNKNGGILGADQTGNLYFWWENALNTDRRQRSVYVDKVDISNNKVETIKLDNIDWAMANSTANLSNRYVKIDKKGNVYQLVMNGEGYKIVKYRFE